jgi:hypothetical protein
MPGESAETTYNSCDATAHACFPSSTTYSISYCFSAILYNAIVKQLPSKSSQQHATAFLLDRFTITCMWQGRTSCMQSPSSATPNQLSRNHLLLLLLALLLLLLLSRSAPGVAALASL